DYNKIKAIKNDLKNGKENVIKKHHIDEETYEEIKEDLSADDFWYYNEKNQLKISPLKYKIFLEGNGFKKYYPDGSDKPTFVKVTSNKVEVTSIAKMKDFVLDYLVELKEFEVWNYCAGYQNLFSEQFLLMLDSIELMMLKDTLRKSYIAFNNGILEITKNNIELKEYIDVDGYIWKSHILNRDWVELDNYENDYSKFVLNISHNEPLPIETCLGYLLCTYKNRSGNKAIILNDEIITQNPEGGTGKGLFIQGVSQIRKTHIIDGKSYNDKASFQNQSVSIDDKVLVFDDVSKNFNFENQFSLITEGITIRHLYKDPIKLSIQDSPKIVITTNYAIKGEGNSHDRRRHEIEIAQYYGGNKTPSDEFGRQLFDEWEVEDFNKFDNYMVHCIKSFLSLGLVKQNSKNLKLRKFIAETSMEFYEWINDSAHIPHNTRNDKKEYYNVFKNEYPDFQKWLNQRTFTVWIQKYCKFKGYNYLKGNSNGLQWFEIENKDKPKEETEEDLLF
ncbi:primase-helicase family protein, partial [Seonamhaeicola sp.]|uniref:primase-helicase family protein n=1 Tax=Seonamhaeicola sp. TaxID=1912245 RepID=UPI003569B82E